MLATQITRCFPILAFVLATVGPVACSDPKTTPDASVTPIDLSPVPAPAGLMAEVFLATPDTTWSKARTAIGGPATFMPLSVGGLIATLLGMPITMAAEVDGDIPALGAIVENPSGQKPGMAVGIHIKSGDRFIDQLTRGPAARFRTTVDATTSITFLDLKEGTSPVAIGILGNYLLVGMQRDDINTVGPYIVRTMPKAPMPKDDMVVQIPQTAIDGPILKAANRVWDKIRGPESAPRAELTPFASTVEGWLAILGDLQSANITVTLDNTSTQLRLLATPKPGSGPASQALTETKVGDVKPLLELPKDTLFGLLVREAPTSREQSLERQADAILRLVGGEVTADERSQLLTRLRAVSTARGDWFVAGLRLQSTGPTAYVRADVDDDLALTKAITELVQLTKSPLFKRFLKEKMLRITETKTVVERLPGDARQIRFERIDEPESSKKSTQQTPAPPPSPVPTSIDLLYLVRPNGLFAAAGYEPREGLRRSIAAPEGENLTQIDPFKTALTRLNSDVSFAVVFDPLLIVARRIGKPDPTDPAPVVLASGATAPASQTPAALWARLDFANVIVREMVRYRAAF